MIDLDPTTGQGSTDPHASAKHTTVVETVFIVVISIAMVLIPVIEVALRKIRGQGPGLGPIVQHLSVWLGFIGALAATAAGKHLGLATTAFLRADHPLRRVARYLGGAVSSVTAMMLTYASYIALKDNAVSTDKLPGGIPEWWGGVIVPVAFLLICVRFIWFTHGINAGWRERAVSLGSCVLCAILFEYGGGHAHAFLWPGVICIVAAFALGAPVFVAMSGLAMLLFFTADDPAPIASVPQATLQLVQNPTLPAIPLLTLAGYVMAAGNASQRLVRAYKSLFGWMPGGLALMAISVMALFTTFTGGSGVTILALGGLVLPALLSDKYPEGFSHGLVTASGSLGLLFPPSLPVILYGAVAGVAAERLFIGGLVPGILLIIIVAAYAIRTGVNSHAPRQPFEGRELVRAMWAAKFDLGLPVVVIVVMWMGWAGIVESAAIGALYALCIELFVFRDVHPWKEMPRVLVQSATLVGAVVILMGVALGLTNYLVDQQIPEALMQWVQQHFHSQWTFLLALNALLLVLGSVFEIYAAIIVLAPLVAPLGQVFNVEPVHLGVVFLANLELGFLFPPMGLNLFLSATRFNKPLPYLYKQALPFLLILAGGVLFITYVPALTTGIVHLLLH
ncbi:MAG TPA: TRAP transporter large permease subunit [Polyangia bacterium]|nr:TRAP transporter large permease subunit [Polyangia bacterium]